MRSSGAPAALAGVLAATTLSAQGPLRLEHVGTFPESFGLLQSVRPLPDGRVMVADPLGGVLAALDVANGTMAVVGREGGGPGEWRQPDGVYPLPGGATLLVDLGNARLTVYDSTGRATETHPMALATGAGPVGLEIVRPRGVDAEGRVYFEARPRPGDTRPGADSAWVKRWLPGAGDPEPVVGLRPPAVRMTTAGDAGDQRVTVRPIPLSPSDDWAVAGDGRVGVVRTEPYRVEWIDADGRLTRGPVLEFEVVDVGEAEKERWLEEAAASGLSVNVTDENGVRNVQFSRGGRRPASARDYEWPESLPAFVPGGARVDSRGRLWVERYVPVGDPVMYDVFDATGRRVEQVRLPAGQQVIGFGEDLVFAVRVDDLGLNWLELYRPAG